MVMKKKAMGKNLTQSILKSFGRYIAIVAIIALGASMFVGLLMTKTDMVATGQVYMDEQNMFDLRIVSSYGWDQDQLDVIRQLPEVQDAEGLLYLDAVAELGGSGKDSVFRFYALPEQVNRVTLRGGRMPRNSNECLIDGYHATDEILGTTITVSAVNEEDTQEALVHDTYTIVGYVSTCLYMDMNRGTTSVGNGKLETYLFIPRGGFDADYFTEIHVTIPGDYEVYTDRYNDAMDAVADRLEPQLEGLADHRFRKVRDEAMQKYWEGMVEYFEGVKEFNEGKREAEQELADAWQEIEDAQREIADGREKIRVAINVLHDAHAEFITKRDQFAELKDNAYKALDRSEELMISGREELIVQIGEKDSRIRELDRELEKLNAQLGPSDEKLQELNDAIAALDTEISVARSGIDAAKEALEIARQYPELNEELIASLYVEIANLEAQVAEREAERAELEAQRSEIIGGMDEPNRERQNLLEQRSQLASERSALQEALNAVNTGLGEMDNARAEVASRLQDMELQLQDGQRQIDDSWAQIRDSEAQLADAEKELEAGIQEYEDAKAEVEAELADAEQKLKDAKAELEEARDLIEDMDAPSLYILDRNSNVGYGSLDSSSNIVQGVSRVFPVFFLLVAALVCITTMTRMIDEERTQIGTLKALGYTNGEIISKYLIYAGSGAVLGCGLGVLVGSIVFPTILWQAYKIMLYITDGIVLRFNWWLCGIVVAAYTTVMLLVTWYCCRKALAEQPAELIRPKAPEAGKKIFLEYLPFWKHISFLNKVTIRNIFRYRQRFAMMMVGIGGCTALLLTGFGLRDSIVNVVDYQFEEVTVYDLQVYFENHQTDTDQEKFCRKAELNPEDVLFYHQQSMELEFDNMTQEIILMASGEDIRNFIDFHAGKAALELPGVNQVLLSTGVAEAMGVRVGDQVTMRNPDMQTLSLTVTGVYDNHVNNYAIVVPETLEDQWGMVPEKQMALVKTGDQDVHALSAKITGMLGVMNVTVSEDFADMVGNMMEALDLVVWVIVFCAGLLAAIVLYNLTNININERMREIATIKVLGFNAGETGAYVFKENLSLSAIGSVLGLGLGYFLLQFVMSQIKLNMVWFKAMCLPVSYVLAVTLTMVAACIVDFVFYFRLEKINMAEALKSVE